MIPTQCPNRPARPALRGASALGLLLLLLAVTAAAGRWNDLRLRSGAAAQDGQRLLTRGVTLTPQFISPGTSPGIQDNALLSITIATNDTLFIGVFLDSANGAPVPGALLDCFCPISNAANVVKTVSINGTFQVGANEVTLDDGQYDVVVRAVTFSATFGDTGRIEEDRIPLTIDRVRPALTSVTNANPKTSYRNGDTIVIDARLDQKGYAITADFTQLDSDLSAEATQIVDNANGSYTIRHTLSEANTRSDGTNLTVPLTFKDKAGNSLRDASLNFCLLNTPPRITSVHFLNPDESTTFRNGDTLIVETRWDPKDSPITLTPESWDIDSGFRAANLEILAQANNVFVLTYVITPGNTSPDGIYCLKIKGQTGGCGTITDQVKICATLDNRRITSLTLDSFPATTRDSLFTVSGRAPGALNVSFKRDSKVLLAVAVDTLGHFTARLPLIDGLNTILAESVDKFLSPGPTTTFSVTRVTRPFLVIPVRFKPESVIRVAPAQTATSLRVEFWNLAGELVAELEDERRADVYEVAWNGRTASGELVRTGPLVCRIDARLIDGTHELTDRAILYSPR